VPFDDCNGHGTHVTGIVAADARNANASQPFVGVAPGVSIFMYRIFGCAGSTSNDLIIDGMTRAFADNVSIVSLSLGGSDGWSEDPASVVADRIVQRGVFFSIAAGNGGAEGALDASSPAAGTDVTSVASVDNIAMMAFNALTSQNQSIVRALKKGSSLC
jgi:subtilisin family serine protease